MSPKFDAQLPRHPRYRERIQPTEVYQVGEVAPDAATAVLNILDRYGCKEPSLRREVIGMINDPEQEGVVYKRPRRAIPAPTFSDFGPDIEYTLPSGKKVTVSPETLDLSAKPKRRRSTAGMARFRVYVFDDQSPLKRDEPYVIRAYSEKQAVAALPQQQKGEFGWDESAAAIEGAKLVESHKAYKDPQRIGYVRVEQIQRKKKKKEVPKERQLPLGI